MESAEFERTAKVFAYVGYTWMGFLFLFFAASFTLDVWRFLVYLAEGLLKAKSGRRQVFSPSSVLPSSLCLRARGRVRTLRGHEHPDGDSS
ncbi:MAG: hypothetical protein MZU91_00050 [Desulfosudis oleivorans]|nr:hypothetical protein [Desulfosudis oleivorans]